MAKSLAASLVAANRPANTAVQDDKVSVKFANPPTRATDVEIEIVQLDPGRSVVTYFGEFKAGKFRTRIKMGNLKVSPTHNRPDDMTLTFDVFGSTFKAMMLDPKRFTLSHKLRVDVKGKVGGRKRTFKGSALLHVFYKTVMIVPTGFAKDPGLNVLQTWARQWQKQDPSVRSIVRMPVIPAVKGKIKAAHYNALITAMTQAAKAAPHGIIAFAIGHGDGGNPLISNPWCDLAPEDGKISDVEYERGLFIDDLELKDGDPPPGPIQTTPGGRTKVKLNALDRCADVFAAHPIRVLVLHTCSAGQSSKFIQRFANRVRVFVRAHKEQIEYIGNQLGSVKATYAGAKPRKDAKTEWPKRKLTREFAPKSPPPKRFKL